MTWVSDGLVVLFSSVPVPKNAWFENHHVRVAVFLCVTLPSVFYLKKN
jgi:hypothetical protein